GSTDSRCRVIRAIAPECRHGTWSGGAWRAHSAANEARHNRYDAVLDQRKYQRLGLNSRLLGQGIGVGDGELHLASRWPWYLILGMTRDDHFFTYGRHCQAGIA